MVSFSFLFLFSLLFFVLTVAWVGVLFDDVSLLWLSFFNFVLLVFVWIFVSLIRKSREKDVVEVGDSPKASSETTHRPHSQFVKYSYKHKKQNNIKTGLWILFGFAIWFGIIFLVKSTFSSPASNVEIPTSLTGYAEDILMSKDQSGAVSTGVIVETTGEVLSTWSISTPSTWVVVDKSFVASGDTSVNTGKVTSTVSKTMVSNTTLKITTTQSVSLLEAIVYLLQTHDTQLSSKKDLKFAGVSATNPYYKYWYTAYKLGLVGPTSSPSTLISCQTYIVLKGMLEKWDVQYTTANVKTQYWAQAKAKDVLNGCVFGRTLKWVNLD